MAAALDSYSPVPPCPIPASMPCLRTLPVASHPAGPTSAPSLYPCPGESAWASLSKQESSEAECEPAQLQQDSVRWTSSQDCWVCAPGRGSFRPVSPDAQCCDGECLWKALLLPWNPWVPLLPLTLSLWQRCPLRTWIWSVRGPVQIGGALREEFREVKQPPLRCQPCPVQSEPEVHPHREDSEAACGLQLPAYST